MSRGRGAPAGAGFFITRAVRQGGVVEYLKIFVASAPKIFSRSDESQAVGNLPPFPTRKHMVEIGVCTH